MTRAVMSAFLLLSGCTGSTGTPAAPPDSLVGDWAGAFYAKGPQGDPMFEISIAISDDDGADVTGGFVTSSGDAMAGDASGTRDGADVALDLVGTKDDDDSEVAFTLTGTASGSTMQGTWVNAKDHAGSYLVELQ